MSIKTNAPLLLLLCAIAQAQDASSLTGVLQRLDRLEQENRTLRDEVRALKTEMEALRPQQTAVEEKLAVAEQRVEEQAQAKVESSQRFPIRITGMALFNAFRHSQFSGGTDSLTTAQLAPSPASGGGSFRQSILGLAYQGPEVVWGGKVRGSLEMDFYNGPTEQVLSASARLRTAAIEIDWKNTSFMVGQQKPIFAPRDPTSLALVGISPMTGSGNLWRWQPQVRLEQRLRFDESTLLRAQVGVYQTSEDSANVPAAFAASLARRRPGLEGRFELSHRFDGAARIEVAPGFHFSSTHVAGDSVPSNVVSLDWLAGPWARLEFSGAFFSGQNVAHFGAFRQGFVVRGFQNVTPIHSRGGWAQLALLATDRLAFHFYGGIHDDRDSDLQAGNIGRNRSGAANLIYRLAPNVHASIEALQIRTNYLGVGMRRTNRYDLAIAYQF